MMMRNLGKTRCGSAVLMLACLLMAPPAQAQDSSPGGGPAGQAGGTIQAALQEILSARMSPIPEIDAALGHKPLEWLRTFYAARSDAPFWVSAEGTPTEAAWVLDRSPQAVPAAVVPLLAAATADRRQTDPHALAQLDLLLSAIYAASAVGPSDPLAAQDGGRNLPLLSLAQDRQKLLRDTLPIDPGFWRLQNAIALYRGLAAVGGWPAVADGPKLDLGADGPRVDALRRRLAATDDLAAAGEGGPYDETLQQAVQHFQARHGLQADGVVGAKTLAALNVTVSRRLDTMAANLVRLQRQHRNWGQRYIAVNIAAASYRLVVEGQTVFERPAVVGRPSWPTPVLDGVIDRVEFHPYWRIPMKIADQEVWPRQDADPSYFAKQGIHVVNNMLVQDPGPNNPLGSVKFVFDNPFSVYLHDTTAPSLFAQAYRFSSHGCIRVSDAGDLAHELLASDPQWPTDKVNRQLQDGGNRTVTLLEPIPLHIVYDTAWVADDGTIQFRDDIYHRDVVPASNTSSAAPGPIANAALKAAASSC